MAGNKISIEPLKVIITQESITSLINSICLYKDKDNDYFSLGLC